MEVALLECEGLPKGCILSIRAGTTRRQAPADAEKFRLDFPKGIKGAEPIKVDVFANLGGASFGLDSGAGRYDLSLGKHGGSPMRVALLVRGGEAAPEAERAPRAGGPREAESPAMPAVDKSDVLGSSSRRHRAAQSAKRYLDAHKLLQWTETLFQDLIREQPDDPWAYIDEQTDKARRLRGIKPPRRTRPTTPLPTPAKAPAPLPTLGVADEAGAEALVAAARAPVAKPPVVVPGQVTKADGTAPAPTPANAATKPPAAKVDGEAPAPTRAAAKAPVIKADGEAPAPTGAAAKPLVAKADGEAPAPTQIRAATMAPAVAADAVEPTGGTLSAAAAEAAAPAVHGGSDRVSTLLTTSTWKTPSRRQLQLCLVR